MASVEEPLLDDEAETVEDALRRVKKLLPRGPIVCILGGTSFQNQESKKLVEMIANQIAVKDKLAVFVTGGMAGVQEVFGRSCGAKKRLFNLVPKGTSSQSGKGTDIQVGRNMDERKAVFAEIGHVYVCVEGGPGVAGEAGIAFARGATVIPLVRTGGASGGKFDFPSGAFHCPASLSADETIWRNVVDTSTHPTRLAYYAQSVVTLIHHATRVAIRREPTLWIPEWVVASDVQDFLDHKWSKDPKQPPLPLGCVCGKGIVIATISNIITWPCYIFFAYFGYHACRCSTAAGTLPKYAFYVWIPFFLFLAIQMYLEFRTLGYAIYSQVSVTSSFSFWGQYLNFWQWSSIMVGFSLLNHMDVATNGFFLATTMFSEECDNLTSLESLWKMVLKQSVFNRLGEDVISAMTIPHIALAFWALTFLQPIVAIVVAYPIGFVSDDAPKKWTAIWPWQVTYAPAVKEGNFIPVLNYRTLMDYNQNHGNALMAVAEVARMGSVTYQDLTFAMIKFDTNLKQLAEKCSMEEALKCLHHSKGLFQRSTFRFLFQGFLEATLQLNLQVTLLGIQRAATGQAMRDSEDTGIFATADNLNHQTLFTIIISFVMAVKRLFDVYALKKSASQIVEKTQEHNLKDCRMKELVKEFTQIQENGMFCLFGTSLFVGSLAYAMAKYVAVFYCRSSLWNFALWPPNGCVDLTHFNSA